MSEQGPRAKIELWSGMAGPAGRFYKTGWTVNVPGQRAEKVETLPHAKAIASEHGASGKWERCQKQDGPYMRTVYVEVMDEQKESQ